MISIGLDIGYSTTKARYKNGSFKIPSIVGTNEEWFSVTNEKEKVVIDGEQLLVGQSAIDQSQIVQRREDRGWINTTMYRQLMTYSLVRAFQSSNEMDNELCVVSGLPMAFFNRDAETLKGIVFGEHTASINGKESTVYVRNVRIVPQPFGTLLDYALTDEGGIIAERADKRIGVIDVGGKTTNILSVDKMAELSREATSVNVGGWTIVKSLTDVLQSEYPDIDDRASAIEKILTTKNFVYYGERIDANDFVNPITAHAAKQISAEISQRWGSGAQFETILITGGGAKLVGQAIVDILPQAIVVADPVSSNANGFWKFANRIS
jgi:plasmid segregation protein ParM